MKREHNTTAPGKLSVSESYYFENGCTIAHNVGLVERISGTRRLIFLECDRDAVLAKLPEGWTIRAGTFPGANLILSFNDWVSYTLPDQTLHKVNSPRFVGFLVPAQHNTHGRSGFMQIYGLAADREYLPGPYRAYRRAAYVHSCKLETDGLQNTWTHEEYRISPSHSTGQFTLRVSHQRTSARRVIASRPNVAVFSPHDSQIERFYQEDLIQEISFAPAMNVANAKDFQLEWTTPDLAGVMTTAKLAAMIYNPVYLRDVYERPSGPNPRNRNP
ncbi:hypothetical protein JJB98_30345 [Bradyrhizobium diazoefficiens]|nr:hypothetical protein [Bradyrhizobium diazoefficiens]QQO23872.1 hypothetical protein JJB98_30345 [Bradyrhizobium diazoefficiens]